LFRRAPIPELTPKSPPGAANFLRIPAFSAAMGARCVT
jgi:hypothetical protein